MPGKKKKTAAEGEAGADAPPAKSGKGKAMALGAGLLLIGAMGQRFVLSSPPAQVVIAAPIDGGVSSGGSVGHGVDCSAVEGTSESTEAETPHPRRTEGASTGGITDLSSQTINLADGHYLKVGITLELGETVVAEEFSNMSAKGADVVLNFFSTKTIDQLTSDRHGAIKTELTCLLQATYATHGDTEAASEPVVTNVLFREFLTS